MQNFIEYPYTISIDKLETTAKEAMQAGYNVTVIINGEYYNVSNNKEKTANTTT